MKIQLQTFCIRDDAFNIAFKGQQTDIFFAGKRCMQWSWCFECLSKRQLFEEKGCNANQC